MLMSAWYKLRDRLDQIGTDNSDLDSTERPIFNIRQGEQNYAKLQDPSVNEENRYGEKIDLLKWSDSTGSVGNSMFINGNPEVGANPNRNKQHGFHFTADNCIGCHACDCLLYHLTLPTILLV